MQVLEHGEYVGQILGSCEDKGMVASCSSYDQGSFNNSWHYHVNAHISFVLRGGCSEKKKESYERMPGKITVYMASEPHQITRMKNSTHINLEMDSFFMQQYGLKESALDRAVKQNPDANFLMLKVYKELLAGDNLSPVSVRMLLLSFWADSRITMTSNAMPPWLSRVSEYLHDHWNRNVNLEELSLVAGVHPVTVSTFFPKYFSGTVGAYLRKIKVEHALNLIKSSDASLTSIAYECGFFDQSHFTRTFKQLTGFLPTAYKML
jgi:AraC family transcriptional regulator